MSMSYDPYLLVWRGERTLTKAGILDLPRDQCRYCSATLERRLEKDWDTGRPIESGRTCNLCGWRYDGYEHETIVDRYAEDEIGATETILRAFKISSNKVALAELGAHLRRRFSDVFALSPRRFELLIGDIFKTLGYQVEMTKQSRDGGVDLFLLSGTGQRMAIVQCKRHREDNKVDVSLVSELLGTQLAFGLRRAILVTTSTFTQPAVDRANAWPSRQLGFEVELLDAYDILKLLQLYNANLPPLPDLTWDFLRDRGIAAE